MLPLSMVLAHTQNLLPRNLQCAVPSLVFSSAIVASNSFSPLHGKILMGGTSVFCGSAALLSGNPCTPFFRERVWGPICCGLVSLLVCTRRDLRICSSSLSSLYLTWWSWSVLQFVVMVCTYPCTMRAAPRSPQDTIKELRSRHPESAFEEMNVINRLGNTLSVFVVRPEQNSTAGRWIIYAAGNATLAEECLEEACALGVRLSASIVVHNPRGVGRSSGRVFSCSDLVDDLTDVAKHFVKQNDIGKSNILFLGHSIGGGVAAAAVAASFRDSALVVDRSFSTLADAARSFVPKWCSDAVAVLHPFLTGPLDTVNNWSNIPHQKKLILYTPSDDVIDYSTASIARLQQFDAKEDGESPVIRLDHPPYPVCSWHNCALSRFTNFEEVANRIESLFD